MGDHIVLGVEAAPEGVSEQGGCVSLPGARQHAQRNPRLKATL